MKIYIGEFEGNHWAVESEREKPECWQYPGPEPMECKQCIKHWEYLRSLPRTYQCSDSLVRGLKVGDVIPECEPEYQLGYHRHPDEPMYWEKATKEEYDEANSYKADCRIMLVAKKKESFEEISRDDVLKLAKEFTDTSNHPILTYYAAHGIRYDNWGEDEKELFHKEAGIKVEKATKYYRRILLVPVEAKPNVIDLANQMFPNAKPLEGEELEALNRAFKKSESQTPTNFTEAKQEQCQFGEDCYTLGTHECKPQEQGERKLNYHKVLAETPPEVKKEVSDWMDEQDRIHSSLPVEFADWLGYHLYHYNRVERKWERHMTPPPNKYTTSELFEVFIQSKIHR